MVAAKNTTNNLLKIGAASLLISILSSATAHADGKQVFLANKCNKCHEGAGISLLPKEPAAEGEEDAEETGPKTEPTKLDGIGAAMTKTWGSADAAKENLGAFLAKQKANPKGKKHKKKNQLTPADVDALYIWLSKL